MNIEPGLTLREAAAILKLDDTRTVRAWGSQGRFLIVGYGKELRVNPASLRDYLEGKGTWHEEQKQKQNAARQEQAPSATPPIARSRSRRPSRSASESAGAVVLRLDRKLKRG